jgi:hypothetical protein
MTAALLTDGIAPLGFRARGSVGQRIWFAAVAVEDGHSVV